MLTIKIDAVGLMFAFLLGQETLVSQPFNGRRPIVLDLCGASAIAASVSVNHDKLLQSLHPSTLCVTRLYLPRRPGHCRRGVSKENRLSRSRSKTPPDKATGQAKEVAQHRKTYKPTKSSFRQHAWHSYISLSDLSVRHC